MSAAKNKATVSCEVSFAAASGELTALKSDSNHASESPSTASLGTQVKVSSRGSCLCSVLRVVCLCLCSEVAPEPPFYLPKHTVHTYGKKTLVLDLDETLVYCSLQPHPKADAILPVNLQDTETCIYLKKRPGLDVFLRTVSELFELVLFTASMAKYAIPVMSEIDPNGLIDHSLFREHCEQVGNGFVKDLSKLGRNLHDVIIIDVIRTQNNPVAYSRQPENGLPISSFFGEEGDKELSRLLPILKAISESGDVLPLLQAYRQMKTAQAYFRPDTPSTTKADLGV